MLRKRQMASLTRCRNVIDGHFKVFAIILYCYFTSSHYPFDCGSCEAS